MGIELKKMGVVITTSKYTKDFLKDCLESIKDTKYPIIVLSNDNFKPEVPQNVKLIINPVNGWEIAGIKAGQEHFDEFIHIMDTTIIKDISLFDKAFAIDGHVVFTKGNYHYMGKFVSKDLPNLPIVKDKSTAIMLEVRWLDGFHYTEFEPDLKVHSNIWEEKFGQNRMRLENEYMIKWKGTVWMSPEQVKELEEEINKKYI